VKVIVLDVLRLIGLIGVRSMIEEERAVHGEDHRRGADILLMVIAVAAASVSCSSTAWSSAADAQSPEYVQRCWQSVDFSEEE
jgi:hypothetical protein